MTGWPRKNEEIRLYRESKGSYVAVLMGAEHRTVSGYQEALANVYYGTRPSLCLTAVRLPLPWATRATWEELPPEWREAFREYGLTGRERGMARVRSGKTRGG